MVFGMNMAMGSVRELEVGTWLPHYGCGRLWAHHLRSLMPQFLSEKGNSSNSSRGVEGSYRGEWRHYGEFLGPWEEKGDFERESVAMKKCSKILGLESSLRFNCHLYFPTFDSLLQPSRKCKIFKYFIWKYKMTLFCSPGPNDSHMIWSK